MSEITKIINEREWEKNKNIKRHLKLDFLQLIRKASLILNSNLELALRNILKERELCEPMYVAVERGCSKNMRLVILFCVPQS